MRIDDELTRGKRSSHRKKPAGRKGTGKRKRIAIIAAEIVILVGLCVFAGYQYIAGKLAMMAQVEFDEAKVENINISEEQKVSTKGYWNIALFGLDSRDMGLGAGNNSDVNMVCSINLGTGEIRLVSIFRDTYLNISEKNSYNKINAAYSLGGPTQAVAAINKNLGLNITEYAIFNWKAVADAINLLGGIDVELSDAEFYYINAFITETVEETGVYSMHLTKAGMNHLDGVQAVAYGRLRLMDTDYARTERQRIVLSKAFEKAKKADWATLNNIIETVLPQVATNVKPEDVIPLAWDIKKFKLVDTAGFPFARGEVKSIGKIVDIVVPQTLESNVEQLHEFLFGKVDYKLPSDVQEISDHIAEATGMYSEGKAVGHVRTDQGYIPKKTGTGKSGTSTKKTVRTTEARETTTGGQDRTTDASQSLEGQMSTEQTREGQSGQPPEDGTTGTTSSQPGITPSETTREHTTTSAARATTQETETENQGPGFGTAPAAEPTSAPRPGGQEPGLTYGPGM